MFQVSHQVVKLSLPLPSKRTTNLHNITLIQTSSFFFIFFIFFLEPFCFLGFGLNDVNHCHFLTNSSFFLSFFLFHFLPSSFQMSASNRPEMFVLHSWGRWKKREKQKHLFSGDCV